jgi:TolB protein
VNADGTRDYCIAEDATSRYFAPAWSPDGSYILFTAKFFASFEKNGIYSMRSDGSSMRQLVRGANEYTRAAWSPDGKRIAYIGYANELALFVMGANGTNVRRLTTGADIYGFAWSPDSTRIAVNTMQDSYVMDANGMNVHYLPYKPAALDTRLAWSPDSSHIAFDSDEGSSRRIALRNIYMTSSDGTSVSQLTQGRSLNVVLGWSPDGKHILFTSDRQGNARTYVMDADGKNPHLLTSNQNVLEASWQP